MGAVGSGVRSQSPAFRLCSRHFRSVFAWKYSFLAPLCLQPAVPISFFFVFTCATELYSVCLCECVCVCTWGVGAISNTPTPLRHTDGIESSQTGLGFKWFHARCYWMSTKTFKTLVLRPPPPQSPHFPTTVQKKNQQCYSSCTWFVQKPYFEYNACRTRCLNQTYEDTNLHLVSLEGASLQKWGTRFPSSAESITDASCEWQN